MNRFKTIVAVLLLAFWVPATSHCLLEMAGLIHENDCCANAHGAEEPGHDAADGQCQIETGNYRLPKPDSSPLEPVLTPCASMALATGTFDFAVFAHGIVAGAPPPDLPVSWQFSIRAAAPPRAPSFLV